MPCRCSRAAAAGRCRCFLTPELQPFYGGTYWPPSSRMGMPGFDQVLLAVADAWKNRRQQAIEQAAELTEHIIAVWRVAGSGERIIASTDRSGRSGAGAKFRLYATADLAVRRNFRIRWICKCCCDCGSGIGEPGLLDMVTTTLDKMAGRRNLRSPGRRISSLFGRRTLAGAAFRKNAVRQRAADDVLYRSISGDRQCLITPTSCAKLAIMCSAI